MRGVQFSNVKRVRRLGATPFVSIEVAVRCFWTSSEPTGADDDRARSDEHAQA
jgi:hypothetical protein